MPVLESEHSHGVRSASDLHHISDDIYLIMTGRSHIHHQSILDMGGLWATIGFMFCIMIMKLCTFYNFYLITMKIMDVHNFHNFVISNYEIMELTHFFIICFLTIMENIEILLIFPTAS